MAYMSDRGGRELYWHGSAAYNADKAIREAKRILAETHDRFDDGEDVGLRETATAPLYGSGPIHHAQAALAERIFAVLPVLDELAESSALDRGNLPYFTANAIHFRNRATDAAIDAR